MAGYIGVPIDTDPQDVAQDAFDYLTAVIPGWTPNVPNLDVWIIQALAAIAAESRDVASQVPTSIFRWFGAYLAGVQPVDASAASVYAVFTALDNKGYTIPANTVVSIQASGSDSAAFQTIQDETIATGLTQSSPILLIAVEEGAAGSGLGGVGVLAGLITPLDFVSTVVLQGITTGGEDAEDDAVYLNRLAATMTLLAPRPILAEDFAIFAREIPGVYRAVAIDGYDPDTATFNNARMVTVSAVDSAGNGVSTPVSAAILADLDARREVNFVVNYVNPSSTAIAVTYSVHLLAGTDDAAVLSSINDALTAYLSSATWGSTEDDPQGWLNTTSVRYLEVAQVINQVSGVEYIASLAIGVEGGALSNADVALPGVAPLPRVGTLTGTVV